MTEKIMVTITFGGQIDYFEAKGYRYFEHEMAVKIDKFDGTTIIAPTMSVMIEITEE